MDELAQARSDIVRLTAQLQEAHEELARRPKWNGGFQAAGKIAWDILHDYPVYKDGDPDFEELRHRIAEALVEAWDDGVGAEYCAANDPERTPQILAKLLRAYGIGIAPFEKQKARMLAVARGELKLPADEPKLWFTSIEAMVKILTSAFEKAKP